MSPMLNRDQLLELLDEVSKELRHERVRAQVYAIGGAAMTLAFSQERRTEDVDARIDRGHSGLVIAVQRVGRRHGLGDSWLNEQATSNIPGAPDENARTLYESGNLTVTGASAKHLLAMKLYAARERDQRDIGTLVDELKLRNREEAVAIYERLFPDEPLKDRAQALLDATFAQQPTRPSGDTSVSAPQRPEPAKGAPLKSEPPAN